MASHSKMKNTLKLRSALPHPSISIHQYFTINVSYLFKRVLKVLESKE